MGQLIQGARPRLPRFRLRDRASANAENARRDRETKLALYSRRDALEYWIVDPVAGTVHQYHRVPGGALQLRGVVGDDEWLRSDLLEGFAVGVSELWP